MKVDQAQKLVALKNLELYYCGNLHAKCYFNDDLLIACSMNLYWASESNQELGILIKNNEPNDKKLYHEILEQVKIFKNPPSRLISKIELEIAAHNAIACNSNDLNEFPEKYHEEKSNQVEGPPSTKTIKPNRAIHTARLSNDQAGLKQSGSGARNNVRLSLAMNRTLPYDRFMENRNDQSLSLIDYPIPGLNIFLFDDHFVIKVDIKKEHSYSILCDIRDKLIDTLDGCIPRIIKGCIVVSPKNHDFHWILSYPFYLTKAFGVIQSLNTEV